MIQMINKLKKNQKGFTLVELIVVLVILAILAAFTIPAMLGFVNDARSKAYIAEARECYVAAQSVTTEMNTSGSAAGANIAAGIAAYVKGGEQPTLSGDQKTAYDKFKAYVDNDLTTGAKVSAMAIDDATSEVTSLTYTVPRGTKTVTIVITDGDAEITES